MPGRPRDYGTYFLEQPLVVASAVLVVTLIGAMAAHCLSRYRFRGNRLVRLTILSGMILPPQLLILSLFQILLQFGLYNTLPRAGPRLCRHPARHDGLHSRGLLRADAAGPVRRGAHGRLFRFRDLLARSPCRSALPAIFTTVVLNFIILWNEFLFAIVLSPRTTSAPCRWASCISWARHQLDVGMIATGLMISMSPIILLYALFSETMIKGMTAGAVR